MTVKKLVVTTLTLLLALTVHAQTAVQWAQLYKKPGDPSPGSTNPPVDLFYSPQIIKKGDLATVSVLNNTGMSPQSIVFEIEYDCKKNVFSFVKGISYDGPKATGKADPASSNDLKIFANLTATDLIGNNEALGMASMISGVSFGALKTVVCEGKSPADYQKLAASAAAAASATKAAAEAATAAENAKIAATFSAVTDWAKLGNNSAQSMQGAYDVLYSPSTTKTGDKVAVKVLSNFLKVEKIFRGNAGAQEDLGSTVVELQFDCKQNTFGFLKVAQYAGPKATGKPYVFGSDQLPDEQKNKPIAQADPNNTTQSVPEALIGKLRDLVCSTTTSDAATKPQPQATTATIPQASAPVAAASTTSNKVNEVDTPDISYVQERPSPIWAEHVGQDQTNYLKETNRTDTTISLEGDGKKVLIDLQAMRVIVDTGKSKKSLNIEEAVSELHGWAVGEVSYSGGSFVFISQEGPIKNWVERKQDGTERKFVEEEFDEWSVYLKSADGKSLVQLDLSKKVVIYNTNEKRSKAITVPIQNASIVK